MDHPRSRGEHFCNDRRNAYTTGSSPQTWGTLAGHEERDLTGRIIPACAGNTAGRPVPCRSCGDHPRLRGEHPIQLMTFAQKPGSSPHTLGTHDVAPHRGADAGIIPASAGNTAYNTNPTGATGDHPRIRGETLLELLLRVVGEQIIPAYAGNTCGRSPTGGR